MPYVDGFVVPVPKDKIEAYKAMARKAAELGHEYLALTDHSPQVSVAHGLDATRLAEQLEKDGFGTAAIHGNKSQGARQQALNAYHSLWT